jgi:hypothetical protein
VKARGGLRLALARLYLPAAIKRKRLADLVALTARAFDAPPPQLQGLRWRARLEAYGLFTRRVALRAIESGAGEAAIGGRLFEAARSLGRDLARELGIEGLPSALAAARVLYRALRIDFRSSPDGGIVVSRCFFRSLYTPGVCALMSNVDAGILAGLAGGGTLRFDLRLTAGDPCCRARFSPEEPR